MSAPPTEPGAPPGPEQDPAAGGRGPTRKPRHVKAAAKLLQREARRILRRHAARVGSAPAEAIRASLAAIDTHRAASDMAALEREAEHLDELLHQHADFARKSPLRETLENVGLAVLVALGLRACLYEPFKIPSGSMMPTLLPGDHIFVNKYIYGVQIPFTDTVVGEDVMGEIAHGDVIVFRFPLDEKDDYIKRVIGLPGDTVKVEGRQVYVKPAGADAFEPLPRKRLKGERCKDESGTRVLPNCALYEESHGDHTYVVRYVRGGLPPPSDGHVWEVPEGHLFVMGDNRNQSQDSRAWFVSVEAVTADGLLTARDLRDLTDETLFSLVRPGEGEREGGAGEPSPTLDRVRYLADHRSPEHDITLEIWRDPPLGPQAVFDGIARTLGGTATTLDELAAARGGPKKAASLRRLRALGEGIDAMVVAEDAQAYEVVLRFDPAEAVLHLRCGKKICTSRGRLASKLGEVLAAFHRDPQQDARAIMWEERSVRAARHWTTRSDPQDRLLDVRYVDPGAAPKDQPAPKGPPARAHLIAWRSAEQGVDRVLDTIFASLGVDRAQVEPDDTLVVPGGSAWILPAPGGRAVVLADRAQALVVELRCDRAVCPTKEAARKLAAVLAEAMPVAAVDRREFAKLGDRLDLGLLPVGQRREKLPYDRVVLTGTVRGGPYTVELAVWRRPEGGLDAQLARLRAAHPELGPAPDLDPGAYFASNDQGARVAVVNPRTEVVFELVCRRGLCPTDEHARDLARRAIERAQDPDNLVDADASRARPFVPRGNVKGRAERIWWPVSRFWLKIP